MCARKASKIDCSRAQNNPEAKTSVQGKENRKNGMCAV